MKNICIHCQPSPQGELQESYRSANYLSRSSAAGLLAAEQVGTLRYKSSTVSQEEANSTSGHWARRMGLTTREKPAPWLA